MLPAHSGRSSPERTASMASSSRAMPSAIWPCLTRARPSNRSPAAARLGSAWARPSSRTRRAGPALVQVAAVGGLQDGRRLLDLAQPPGGVAEGVEVGGGQLAGGAGGREALAGGPPVAAAVGVPGRLQQ